VEKLQSAPSVANKRAILRRLNGVSRAHLHFCVDIFMR
jgi:hypothetical protein